MYLSQNHIAEHELSENGILRDIEVYILHWLSDFSNGKIKSLVRRF